MISETEDMHFMHWVATIDLSRVGEKSAVLTSDSLEELKITIEELGEPAYIVKNEGNSDPDLVAIYHYNADGDWQPMTLGELHRTRPH